MGAEAGGTDRPAWETESSSLIIGKLFAVVAAAPIVGEMPVILAAKPGQQEREATLRLQVTSVSPLNCPASKNYHSILFTSR